MARDLMMLVLHNDAKREYAYGPAQRLPDTKVGTFTQALYDVMHLAWLNATRRLFVGRLSFVETTQARLSTPPTAGDIQKALEKDWQWRPVDGVYELERHVTGRVVITNYDPRTLSNAERNATEPQRIQGISSLSISARITLEAISHCSAL